MRSKNIWDGYFAALLLIAIIYVSYWTSWAAFRYNSFSSQLFDIGLESYATYAHINYAYLFPGPEYLVFAGHVSPLRVLLLPFSLLLEGPLGLVMIQDSALALAAIVVYFCGRDLLRSRMLGFSLAIGFLLNPGVTCLVVFDFHSEAFLPLFFLLAFYFYMKKRRLYLALSFGLLLSVIEFAWVVGLSFVVGMAYYEFVHNRKELLGKGGVDTVKTLCMCLFLTLFFALFYSYIAQFLTAMYQANQYSATPSPLKLYILKIFSGTSGFLGTLPALFVLALVGVAIVFFGLCFSGLIFDPVLGILMISPWLAGLFVLRFPTFFWIYLQYYAYGIGGAMTASILGLLIFFRKGRIKKNLKDYKKIWAISIIASTIIFSTLLLVSTVTFTLNPFNWNTSGYSVFETALKNIPANANVLAQSDITPHLYYVQNLEISSEGNNSTYSAPWLKSTNNTQGYTAFYWFKPTYIVLDRQFPSFDTLNNSGIYNSIPSDYTLYNQTGAFEIYKLKST